MSARGNSNGWLGFIAGLLVGRRGSWKTLGRMLLLPAFLVIYGFSWLGRHPVYRVVIILVIACALVYYIDGKWGGSRLRRRVFPSGTRAAEPPRGTKFARTQLYRWFDAADKLLYVGITNNLGARTSEHSESKEWMQYAVMATVEHYDTRDEALAAEKYAIQREHPRFNIQHNGTRRSLL